MSQTPDLFDGSTDFESWREYREKRNRRTIYVLVIVVLLLLLAMAFPAASGAVFGVGNNVSDQSLIAGQNGTNGLDGTDGTNGINGTDGLNGQPGLDGFNGLQGPAGPAGAAGPAGPAGPAGANGSVSSSPAPSASPSSGTLANGQAKVLIGTCDTNITAKMQSRFVAGVFKFGTLTLGSIDSSCNGNVMDVFLSDSSDNVLAEKTGILISGSSVVLSYSDFATGNILSSAINSVALEIRG